MKNMIKGFEPAQANDDVADLFSAFGFGAQSYKKFEKPTLLPPPVETKTAYTELLSLANAVAADPVSKIVRTHDGVDHPRFKTLRTIFSHTSPAALDDAEITYRGSPNGRALHQATISVHSVAGGAGKTTVLATLARALSQRGERIVLVDTSRFSTLPLFFGVESACRGACTFVPFQGTGTPTHLLLPDDQRDDGASTDSVTSLDDWIDNGIARLNDSFDRILLDSAAGFSEETNRWLFRKRTALFVLEPDMRSASGLSRLNGLIAGAKSAGSSGARGVRIVVVLNKFDPTLDLHIAFRNSLRSSLDPNALMFVIRQDNAVAEAIAEGLTVMDYAPQCAAAKDYLELIECIKRTD